MKIYHYHKITKEYLGESEAKLDFLETKKQEQDIFSLPANSTKDAPPPISANEIPVFNGTTWVIKNDFRGTIYWLLDGTTVKIKAIGDIIPIGAPTNPPPIDMVEPLWTKDAWEEQYSPTQEELDKEKVNKEIRQLAITSLISKGELLVDYKE